MRMFVFVALACCAVATGTARSAEPTANAAPAGAPSATAADVEALRQQVQSLTAMVQTLQQEVKDQQAAMGKNNSTAPSLPQNPEPESAEGDLLGLYEGGGGAFHLPDKITIYQRPHEQSSRNLRQLQKLIDETVWHEVAHYFGLNESEVLRAERRRARSSF